MGSEQRDGVTLPAIQSDQYKKPFREVISDAALRVVVDSEIAAERVLGWGVYRALETSYRLLDKTRFRKIVNPPLWFDVEKKDSLESQLRTFVTTYCSGVSLETMSSMRDICSKNKSEQAEELAQLLDEQITRNRDTTDDYLRRYPVNILYNSFFSAGITLGSIRPELFAPLMGSSIVASINAVHRYASIYDKMNTDLRDLNINGLLVWRFFDLYQKGVIQNVDDQILNVTSDIAKLYNTVNEDTAHRGTQLGAVIGSLLSGDVRQVGVALATLTTAHSLAWLATRGRNIGPWFMENDARVKGIRRYAKRDKTRIKEYVDDMREASDMMAETIHDSNFRGRLPSLLVTGVGQLVGTVSSHLLNLHPTAFPLFLAHSVGQDRYARAMTKVGFSLPKETIGKLQSSVLESYETSILYFNELLSQGNGNILEAFRGAIIDDREKNQITLTKYLTLKNREWQLVGKWILRNGVNILLGPSEIGKSSLLFFLTSYLDQARIPYTEATNADTMEFSVLLANGKARILKDYILNQLVGMAQKETSPIADALLEKIGSPDEQNLWNGWSDTYKTTEVTLCPEHEMLDLILTQFLREKVGITNDKVLRGTNSLGAQQRIKFAKTILDADAQVVILDETINNIDERTKLKLMREFGQLIDIYHRDKIFILTTHDTSILTLLQRFCMPDTLSSIAIMDESQVSSQDIQSGDIASIVMREKWNTIATKFLSFYKDMIDDKGTAEKIQELFDADSPQVINSPGVKSRLVAFLSTMCSVLSEESLKKFPRSQMARMIATFIDNLDYDVLDVDLKQELNLIKVHYISNILVGAYSALEIPSIRGFDGAGYNPRADLIAHIKNYTPRLIRIDDIERRKILKNHPYFDDDIAYLKWMDGGANELMERLPRQIKWAFNNWYLIQRNISANEHYRQFIEHVREFNGLSCGVLLAEAFRNTEPTSELQYEKAHYYISLVSEIAEDSKYYQEAVERFITISLEYGMPSFSPLQKLSLLNLCGNLIHEKKLYQYLYYYSLMVTHDSEYNFRMLGLPSLDYGLTVYNSEVNNREALPGIHLKISELLHNIDRRRRYISSGEDIGNYLGPIYREFD